jgi:hypothetical protein
MSNFKEVVKLYIAPKSIAAPRSPQIKFTPNNTLDGGVDYVNKEWKISANKTSKALNVWYLNGELSKRIGQDLLNYIGSQPIISSYKFLFKDKIIVHYGDKLLEIEGENNG